MGDWESESHRHHVGLAARFFERAGTRIPSRTNDSWPIWACWWPERRRDAVEGLRGRVRVRASRASGGPFPAIRRAASISIEVAHLADQNDVGILAQDRAQTRRKRMGVA